MPRPIQIALDTSEVWATLIPLLFLAFTKRSAARDIVIYLWVSLFLNTIIVVISFVVYNTDASKLPFLLQNNTIEYNILSICRVFIFSVYFIRNGQDALKPLKRMILAFFL